MAYFFRVFCTSDTVPPLADVLKWVNERGVPARVDPNDIPEGATTVDWGESPIGIIYQEGKLPFLVEMNKKDGEDSLGAQEVKEFLSELGEVKKSRKRDRVIEHLQQTRFVVACQIPIEDFDDAGFHAVDVFLAYFVVHCNGLVQADGQGFYENGKLTVEME